MAQSTVNQAKMKQVSNELDKIQSNLETQIKKLDECLSALSKIWQGEAANTYLQAVSANQEYFYQLATSVRFASETLGEIAVTYDKADSQASELIRSKMGRG